MNTNTNTKTNRNNNNSPLIGLDRYEIISELSNTLQGRIYSAIDRTTGKKCVVKEAWKHLVKQRQSRKGDYIKEDFLREMNTLLNFSKMPDLHPGLISAFDTWEDQNSYFVVMDYCDAELFDYIKKSHSKFQSFNYCSKQNSYEWTKIVKNIFKQIVEAVAWMHSKGYCHLDLSLENTMISEIKSNVPKVKIIDFGVTKKFARKNGKRDFTTQGNIGKTQYMCPKAYARKQYDARAADVYCLGVMLFMMLVGSAPYTVPDFADECFRYCVSGNIKQLLRNWNRVNCVSKSALDLLNRILTFEHQRISINEILKHPFLRGKSSGSSEKKFQAQSQAQAQAQTQVQEVQQKPTQRKDNTIILNVFENILKNGYPNAHVPMQSNYNNLIFT